MLSTLLELEQKERASVPNGLYAATLSLSGAGVRERNHRYQHNIVPTVLGTQSKATANIRGRTRREAASCAIDDPCPGKPLFLKKKSRRRRPHQRLPPHRWSNRASEVPVCRFWTTAHKAIGLAYLGERETGASVRDK
jgi:hypothetical protein